MICYKFFPLNVKGVSRMSNPVLCIKAYLYPSAKEFDNLEHRLDSPMHETDNLAKATDIVQRRPLLNEEK